MLKEEVGQGRGGCGGLRDAMVGGLQEVVPCGGKGWLAVQGQI